MTRALKLEVAKLSNNDQALTGKVFVSSKNFSLLGSVYVVIKGYYFALGEDKNASDSHVLLSVGQRNRIGSGISDLVDVSPHKEDRKTIFAENVTVEVNVYGNATKKVNADVLEEEVRKYFTHIPLISDFDFIVKVTDTFLIFKPTSVMGGTITHFHGGNDPVQQNVALYNANFTVFKLVKAPGQKLIVDGDLSGSSAAGLFKQKLDLESMGIGGLDEEFARLFRRAFASRVFPPSYVKKIGLRHVKGILLYGPPGTGKTLMARQIAKILDTVEPKIVNGPELLDKYVGGSEAKVRELFADARRDQERNGDDSKLHLIIFDEFDSLCRKRGSARDSTGTSDNVVNQLLSMIDGVDALNNVLIIGMTNRKDLLDPAILRPGRLEVHIEISLPDENGRIQIFNIHTEKLKANGALDNDVNIPELASMTANYTGAEIEDVVRAAASLAFSERIDMSDLSKIKTENFKIGRGHFLGAINEVRPAFGVHEEDISRYIRKGIIDYSDKFIKDKKFVEERLGFLKNSKDTNLFTFYINGPRGAGSTAFAVSSALNADFAYIKVVSGLPYAAVHDDVCALELQSIYEDACKSPYSVIVFDDIDLLVKSFQGGARFSTSILQTIRLIMRSSPPHKLAIFVTTSDPKAMSAIGLNSSAYDFEINLKPLQNSSEASVVVKAITNTQTCSLNLDSLLTNNPVPIKKFIQAIDFVMTNSNGNITETDLSQAIKAIKIHRENSDFQDVM